MRCYKFYKKIKGLGTIKEIKVALPRYLYSRNLSSLNAYKKAIAHQSDAMHLRFNSVQRRFPG